MSRPLDLKQFWQDNAFALAQPFSPEIKRPALGMGIGVDAIFAELGLESDLKRIHEDYDFAVRCVREYNRRADEIIGRHWVSEEAFDPTRKLPSLKLLGQLFECPYVWQSESWWLLEAAHTPAELSALLDRVEKLDIEAAMFPDDWDARCKEVYERHGLRPTLPRHQRGPVTLATSIYGTENLLFLIMDEPELAARFRDVLLQTMLRYFAICQQRTAPDLRRPGFSFADDNCALLTPDMYAFFAQPILQAMYERFAPEPTHPRYQHSDSDMGHLLPLLAQTGMNRVNFGPNVRFADIRRHMPRAVVEGTIAPFTMMRNQTARIIYEIKRDLWEARETRGLVVATAGSVNDGTLLSSVRTVMETMWNYDPAREGPPREPA